jgi:hypothetical protein
VERWTSGRGAGKDALLLLVASTDRIPLSESLRRRFEANVGLARARGETIRALLLQTGSGLKPELRLTEEQMLVVVSGPRQTPQPDRNSVLKGDGVGFPEDRRVDVWAIWGSKHH